MFSGAGGWSRGYTLDPETGRWVEVTGFGRPEEQAPAPEPAPADGATREERRAAARRQRPNRAQAAAAPSLFGGLSALGGQGADGSGQFEGRPDLKAVAQEAALAAMSRTHGGDSPSVTQDDFNEALAGSATAARPPASSTRRLDGGAEP